jgi:hypothetical protein
MSSNGSSNGRRSVRYGTEPVERGAGGDTHQTASEGRPPLTTRQGVPVRDDQNTLRAGERGPALLATPLLEAAGVASRMDEGFVAIDEDGGAQLLERCRDVRFWERELAVPVMQ